jgi:hypothetical protein
MATSVSKGLRLAGGMLGLLSIVGGALLAFVGIVGLLEPPVIKAIGANATPHSMPMAQIAVGVGTLLCGAWIWNLSNAIAQIADAFPPKE